MAAAAASPREKSALGRGPRSHARSAPRPGQLRSMSAKLFCGRIELVATFVHGLPMADGLALVGKEGRRQIKRAQFDRSTTRLCLYTEWAVLIASDGRPGGVAANARFFRRRLCIPLLV